MIAAVQATMNWKRAVGILLIVTFLPASVLAGTPLRLCIGDDGHRVIEVVITADHHADDDEHECRNPHERHVSSSSECSDRPLLGAAQQVRHGTTFKPSAEIQQQDLTAILPVARIGPVVPEAHGADWASRQGVRIQPQLETLRTVILRI